MMNLQSRIFKNIFLSALSEVHYHQEKCKSIENTRKLGMYHIILKLRELLFEICLKSLSNSAKTTITWLSLEQKTQRIIETRWII